MKNIFGKAALTLALALVSAGSYAVDVKGKILDANGNPVIGATILNKANGAWATTDVDGNYIVDITKGQEIEISCLGYTTAKQIYDGNVVNFVLAEESLELDEAVAIGYGSVKKKDLSGAVGTVGSKLIEQQSVTQLSQSLQGAMPGLQVTRSSGMPGASATLQIRGVTTMGETAPLIIVDGMSVASIDNVAPEDVEQITVLKDAASAAIYGARAAAGVILVTTKSAREGQVAVNYKGEVSAVTPTELPSYLTDPYDYMVMYNEWKYNTNPAGGQYQGYTQEHIANYDANHAKDPIEYPNFDWKSAILHKAALKHNHNLSMTYGNSVVKTRISASYTKTNALYDGSDHQRFSVRMRNSINIAKKLTGTIDFSYRHAIKNDPHSGSPIKAANMYPAIYAGYYPDGRVAEGKSGGSNTWAAYNFGGTKNNTVDNITAIIGLNYKPVKGLELSANVNPSFNFSAVKDQQKKVPIFDAYETSQILNYVSGYNTNALSETRTNYNSIEIQALAQYSNTFGKNHNFNAMVGYEEYMYNHETMSAGTNGMDFSEFPYLDRANMNSITVGGNAYQNAYRSVFGRVMYNYRNTYYVQLNARGDASSRFHPDHRWGFFPSASLAWVMSNEKWMQGISDVLSYLKLRASYGSLGNERIGNYPYQTYINFYNAIMAGANGKPTSVITAAQTAYAYPDITWETTSSLDFGLDATFFNNRLDLTADYFYKKTKNMLIAVDIPDFSGYSAPDRNAGDMYTRGWEFKIGWKDKVGDFTYGVSFNMSDARSIMGSLNGYQKINSDGTIIREGDEYLAWYGYRSLGLFKDEEDVAMSAKYSGTNSVGDVKYKDLNEDGKIEGVGDREVIGSSLPHFFFGGSINLGWKGLNLSVLFNGVAKHDALITSTQVQGYQSDWLSAPAVLLNRDGSRNYWSSYNTEEQNAKVRYPRLVQDNSSSNYQVSDYWLFNGAYFRIKNVNLSYTIPSKCFKNSIIDGLKLYINLDDPVSFDHYLPGWDPEAGASTYIARTYTFGVDIKF